MLLDVDGTLLDSNDAHARGYVRALAEQGIDVPFARVRPLIGMGSDKLLPALGIEPSSRVGERAEARKKEIFTRELLPELRPTRGARDLLLVMKKNGLTLSVATSASSDELNRLLRAAHIDDLIDTGSTSSDAGASKPDPDIVEASAARAGLPRPELVMLGDTPYDIEAAHKAGVRIIALRCGGWADSELRRADAIYDDPADLVAHYGDASLGDP